MSDKELLELAAKAAEIEGKWWHQWVPTLGYSSTWKEVFCLTAPNGAQRVWNPLEDDGDALRLAVKIGQMELVDLYLGKQRVAVDFDNGTPSFVERHGDDACAATRRAIVRAAAEIGRA